MDKEEYIGEYKDGKYHGKGTLTLSDGTKYVGDFFEGKFHGTGTYTIPSGEKRIEIHDSYDYYHPVRVYSKGGNFFGEFKNGLFDGNGIYESSDILFQEDFNSYRVGEIHTRGIKFIGEFKDGKYHGNGILTISDGTQYIGGYKDGLKNGYGIYYYWNTWISKAKYVGEFKDDEFHGKGIITFSNKEQYIGDFLNGQYHGNGKLTLPAGSKKLPDFPDDYWEKKGYLIYSNGAEYFGEFKNDKFHGKGTFVSSDIEIKYLYDEFPKQYYDCGKQYEGEFIDGYFHGIGELNYSDGTYYKGEFQCGLFQGNGELTYADGEKYEGQFQEGNYHGFGTLTLPNGQMKIGDFKDGVFKLDVISKDKLENWVKKKLLQKISYLFFDTETTGLPKDWKAPVSNLDNWPRLVQLAYLGYDKEGNQICSGDFIIKPNGFSIPADSSRIHGITNEKAKEEGKSIYSVLETFAELVDQTSYLVAHNMSFDEKVIGAEFLRNGMKNVIESKSKICTMEKTTIFCAISGPYGNKWPKLSELHYKLFKTDFEEAHNAAVDISATAKCFWELKKRGIV